MHAAALRMPRVLTMAALFAKRSVVERGGSGPPGGGPAVAELPASGYDRVGVASDGGEIRWFSRGEFQALTLVERVRILSGGGARFYRGPLEVSAMEAMRGMP
jgi:hypothetical protein